MLAAGISSLVALAALVATLALSMWAAERLMTRLLGLPRFRWFDGAVEPAWWWKRLLVRAVSALSPFAICAAIFFITYAVGGVAEPTTTVITVLPDSAAQEAGLRNGDRVLDVGGATVRTFDELRASVQASSGTIEVTLERDGQRRRLDITPRGGRIGVAPAPIRRPISVGEAAARAAGQPLQVVAQAAKSFLALSRGVEMKGPIGIVSESNKTARDGWLPWLFFLGIIGSYFWPLIAALHVFDAVTGWTFRVTNTDTSLREPELRLARLRFTLYGALGCWGAYLLAQAAGIADVPGTAILAALAIPGVWSTWPLLWASARSLWPQRSPLSIVVPVAVVPCAAPIMAGWVARRLREEQRRLQSHD